MLTLFPCVHHGDGFLCQRICSSRKPPTEQQYTCFCTGVDSLIPSSSQFSVGTFSNGTKRFFFSLNLIMNLLSLQGALIPKALSHKRLRKISIEVHRLQGAVAPSGKKDKNGTGGTGSYEECIVRFLQPADKETKKAAKAAYKETKHHRPIETASLLAASTSPSVAHDDTSVMEVPGEYHESKNDYLAKPDFDKGWEAKYRFPINCMSIKGTSKSGVFIRIELGSSKHTRQLIFDDTDQAEDFCSVVQQELKLESERGEAKLRLAFAGKDMPVEAKGEITYLMEVVSAWNIPAGDLFSSDPYVIVSMHGKEIHRTKYISKT